jgi:ABC-type transporter MlaC component
MDLSGGAGHLGLALVAMPAIMATVSRPALRIAAVIALAWSACTAPASGETRDAASLNFIGRLNTAIKKATAATGDLRVAAQRLCEDLGDSALDLEAMMKTASADAWDRMDPSQAEAYRAAFRRRILRDCEKSAADYLRATVELAGVRSLANGEKIIGTRNQASDDGKILMWQVHSKEAGKLMVTDVLVEGRSAMLTLREQASLAIERNPGDVSALIDSLER